jgi:hypothetical protein
MRTSAAVAWLAVAAATLLAAGAGMAQAPETTLPAVIVTAPRTPPPPPFGANRGMLGNLRVEENKWPVIPCSGARVGDAAAGTCQDGPKVIATQAYMGGTNIPIGYGDCTIVHQLIKTDIGRFAVEADVLVFDPYKVTADRYNGMCTVSSGYDHMPQDFKDMNQVARGGAGWSDFRPGDGQPNTESTIRFDDGGRACVALERLGPLWHGGFVWVLHATLCAAGASPPIPLAEVDAAANTIRISTYDPVGNLRRAPGR